MPCCPHVFLTRFQPETKYVIFKGCEGWSIDIHAQVGGEDGKPKLKSLGFEIFSPPKSKPRLPPWGLKMAKGDADPTEATFSLSVQTKLIDLTHA